VSDAHQCDKENDHIKLGRSASKGVQINRGETPKLGPLGPRPFRWTGWVTSWKDGPVLPRRIWSF